VEEVVAGGVAAGRRVVEVGEAGTEGAQGDLPRAIQSSMQPSSERKIYIAADAPAKYGDVKP